MVFRITDLMCLFSWRCAAVAGLMTLSANVMSADNYAYPEPIASWSEAVKEGQRQAAKEMQAKLAKAIADKAGKFVIPPGDYRFKRSWGGSYLGLNGVSDMTIEGKGVTFWFEPWGDDVKPILLDNCRNVKITGLTIDVDPPANIQGEVIKLLPDEDSLILKLDPGFSLPQDKQFAKWWFASLAAIKTKVMIFDKKGLMRSTVRETIKEFNVIDDKTLKVKFNSKKMFQLPGQVELGDRMPLYDRGGKSLVRIKDSSSVTLEDITIYWVAQFGITESGGDGGNIYRRVKIVRRPGTQRMLVSNADTFHSISVKNGPLIEQCEFSFSGDDFINIHSELATVWSTESQTQLRIFQNASRLIIQGEELIFYADGDMSDVGRAKVTRAVDVEGEEKKAVVSAFEAESKKTNRIIVSSTRNKILTDITLDQPVKAKRFDICGVESHMAKGTVIRDSYFHDNLVRGIVCKARDAVITGNRIERTGRAGILLGIDKPWLEGPAPHNVEIIGNTLTDCGIARFSRTPMMSLGAITLCNAWSFDQKTLLGHQIRNVKIKDNKIIRPALCGIYLSNVADVDVTDNIIEGAGLRAAITSDGKEPDLSKCYGIYVDGSENTKFQGNKFVTPAPLCRGNFNNGKQSE